MVRHFHLLHSVQNGSGAHSASYPMGAGGLLPGGGLRLTNYFHLVPRPRKLKLYLHSPINLEGEIKKSVA
jgi:hypothetical protein